jgi:hypothetical protein
MTIDRIYRDAIIKAVEGRNAPDGAQNDVLDSLARTLRQAAIAKEVLRNKGYGRPDMSIDYAVKAVPPNK